MATVLIRIPESLLKRAQQTTGQRDPSSAVRRALEIATHAYDLKAGARRGLIRSRREERAGKSHRFKTAKEAIAYLRRL